MHVADADTEGLSVVREHVDELTSELDELTTGIEQGKVKCDALARRILELEVIATTCIGEFGVVIQAVRSLRNLVVTGKNPANTAEVLLGRH